MRHILCILLSVWINNWNDSTPASDKRYLVFCENKGLVLLFPMERIAYKQINKVTIAPILIMKVDLYLHPHHLDT